MLYSCLSLSFFRLLTSLLPYCLSPRLCLLSLSFFLFLVLDVSFVFLNRSFSFLRHCYVFDIRCRFPIVFREFSPTSFAFSAVLSLSPARCFFCFPNSEFLLSYVTALGFRSRILTLFRQFSLTLTLFFPTSFAFLSLFLFLTSVLSFRCLSQ